MEPFLKCRCLEYANKLSKVLKNHSFVGIVGTCVLSCFVQKCILYVDSRDSKEHYAGLILRIDMTDLLLIKLYLTICVPDIKCTNLHHDCVIKSN